ncbi:serine hydrolase domain-containing protein [Streptomyces antarcticus]|uniref:serine hydrolase domain-containing protein n=1 Tax=Streptomyces antarcticus TaxID=2996458 RepID=UPI00226DE4F8|nr:MULTISPECIES: serine hydrolase domain-containing protein [unclassified Streptomyces]MCY0941351.1 serine hydrolase [Streptomyces sp. H34-AA3]MCZ4084777.1 serine hydrolase [Streptomyces sp. H34-S5]
MNEEVLRRAVGSRPDDDAHAVLVRLTGPDVPDGCWTACEGVADPRTGEPAGPLHRFRIGGVTKIFLATVVLGLAAEGALGLDDPVESLLPGLIDPAVTVRQLLDHTSGLADESDVRYNDTGWFLRHRYDTFTAGDRLALPLKLPLSFPPGTRQQLTRANYEIAALVVERLTGRGYAREIEDRVLRPLDLSATCLPGTDPTLPVPHLRGHDLGVDVTEHNPSIHGPAGEMVSNLPDLDRFLVALVSGELLPAAQTEELFRVPEVPYVRGHAAYAGSGLDRLVLPDGVEVWGMAGLVHGALTGIVTTRDLRRRLTYAVSPTERGTVRLPPVAQELVAAAFSERTWPADRMIPDSAPAPDSRH